MNAESECELQIQVRHIVVDGLRKGLSQKEVGRQLTDMLEELGGVGPLLLSESSYVRYVAKEVLELNGRHN